MSSPTESECYLVRKNSTTVAHGVRLSRNINGNLLSPVIILLALFLSVLYALCLTRMLLVFVNKLGDVRNSADRHGS
jgi:hypothetical protein